MTDHLFDKHIKNLLRNYKTRVPAGLWNKISLEVKNELFDEHVKDALSDHESNVPLGLWEKINAEQKKERRPVAWWQNAGWMAGIAALLLLLIGGYYYTVHSTKENTATADTHHSSNTSTSTTTTLSPATQGSSSTVTDQPSVTAGDQPLLQNATTAKLLKKHRAGNNRQQMTSDDNAPNTLASVTDRNDGNMAQAVPGAANAAVTQPGGQDSATLADGTNSSMLQRLVFGQEVVTPFGKLNNNSLTAIQRLQGASSFSLACPNTIKPTWFLEVYGSPDYTMQRLHATSASSAYLKRKDSTETMQGGFTFGARLSRTISEHWLLKTGLQYAQVNQRFSIRTENEIKTSTLITTRAIVRNPGDTLMVRDTSTLTQVGYRLRTTQNRYRSLEIPLIASYETGNNNWHFGFNGGVIVNAISWYNGETLDTAYNVVPLSAKNTNGVYRSAINLSAYLGVSIMRRISSDMEIFAEPYFRYGLTSSSISNLGYSQSFNAAGLSLGIRYQLNNKGSKYSR